MELIGHLTVIFLSCLGLAQLLDIILAKAFIPALKGIARSVSQIWNAWKRQPGKVRGEVANELQ